MQEPTAFALSPAGTGSSCPPCLWQLTCALERCTLERCTGHAIQRPPPWTLSTFPPPRAPFLKRAPLSPIMKHQPKLNKAPIRDHLRPPTRAGLHVLPETTWGQRVRRAPGQSLPSIHCPDSSRLFSGPERGPGRLNGRPQKGPQPDVWSGRVGQGQPAG